MVFPLASHRGLKGTGPVGSMGVVDRYRYRYGLTGVDIRAPEGGGVSILAFTGRGGGIYASTGRGEGYRQPVGG